MKITRVEVIPLYCPEATVVKGTCLVRVVTDEGVEGFGQAEIPAMIASAFVKTREWEVTGYFHGGLERVLVGENPLNVERLWQKMYASMWLYGRRGAGVSVMTAIDTALWDIKGKILGKPVHELLWGAWSFSRLEPELVGPRTHVRPYATVYPSGSTPDEVRHNLSLAVNAGFEAVKLEEGERGFARVSVEHDVALVSAAREAIGRNRDLMLDVQYVWSDYMRAFETIKAIEQYDVFFVEAPLPPDSLEAYATLAEAVDTRIACGDGGYTTRFEFKDLMERGKVDVVQPSMVRSGGITETLRIAAMAFEMGKLCIPHCYAWMVGVAAAIQVAAVVPNMPYIEMPSPHPYSPLVSELLIPTPQPVNGMIEVPKSPGLGYRINEKILEKYRVDAF
ncbi:MAG: mandelate racemase/muconate lactonizing enzyme family protein [Candidatus Caldarchaeum sp.]|nr:mandelate racemase/muconate lactonizing enzyme family protein [Candidatus Caldarchaeum sp.]